MVVDDHDVTEAGAPLIVTVLPSCAAPKFVPVMVTPSPGLAVSGFSDTMVGGGMTVKGTPLLS
jgi:hypothetical protein